MNFTRSEDGIERTTLRLEVRLTREEIEEAKNLPTKQFAGVQEDGTDPKWRDCLDFLASEYIHYWLLKDNRRELRNGRVRVNWGFQEEEQ